MFASPWPRGLRIAKAKIRLVVHWTLPRRAEAYDQEAGRAGSDGQFARLS
jgi:superfamily II DNA helicase RecQ